MIERIVSVRRVTKVVKGGRIFSFAALVVVGDSNGSIGLGKGKAREAVLAVQKAIRKAHKQVHRVVHTKQISAIYGLFKTTKIVFVPVRYGKGITASFCVRCVLEVLGLDNITAKCYGSTNPLNVVVAAINGLTKYGTAWLTQQKLFQISYSNTTKCLA